MSLWFEDHNLGGVETSRSSGEGRGRSILSLDGGGPRGTSQLKILLEIIHRMEYERERNTDQGLDQIARPCECFDMIGGSGTGGFIAILLVTLGLDIAVTLDEFSSISDKILSGSTQLARKERMEMLRSLVGDLLRKYGFQPDAKLKAPNKHDRGCKLVVPVMQAHNLGVPIILRNHEVKSTTTPDITIMDAILSTCASPALFTAVNVEEGLWDHSYVSADQGLSNPTREVIKAAYEAFGEEEYVACLLSLGTGHLGVIRMANGASAEGGIDEKDVALNEISRRIAEDPEQVARQMDEAIGSTGLYFRFSVDQGMQLSKKAAERRESMKHMGSREGSLGVIMADTLTYLGQPKIAKDVDHCADTLFRKVGLETLNALHRPAGVNVVARNLPPMVGHFVKREAPWKRMLSIFFCEGETIPLDRQIIMVLSGMGGLGKTQLVLYFAREFRNMFSSIIFVDSSSVERLKADILRHVRSDPKYSRASFERSLEVLAQPPPESESISGSRLSLQPRKVPWLIIYDNCDNRALELASFLPRCDFGCIIITTRILSFQNLQPHNAFELETMSPTEAVETLLFYSGRSRQYPTANSPSTTEEDKGVMEKIAETLGHLPLALVQAACHVQETGESWARYRSHLEKNITALMSKSPKAQRDGYKLSSFAAFYATFNCVPALPRRVLPLFSFFHSRNFPLDVIESAAQGRFRQQHYDYQMERLPSYQNGIKLLNECFCPGDAWDGLVFDEVIATLRNYSLISVSHANGVRLLHMHPLIRSWTRTLVPNKQLLDAYHEAAVRILAAAACQESGIIDKHLVNYLIGTKLEWSAFHLNDKTAFAAILHRNGEFREALKIRAAVYTAVKERFRPTLNIGLKMHRKALTELAESYRELGYYAEAIRLYGAVYKIASKALAGDEPDTLEAVSNLVDAMSAANTKDDLHKCVTLLSELYQGLLSRKEFGPKHHITLQTAEKLAMIYHRQEKYQEAEQLQLSVLLERKRAWGKDDKRTIEACENMGRIYASLEKFPEAERHQNDVVARREKRMGTEHRDTIRAKSYLAKIYLQSQRYEKARELYQDILNNRIRVLGPNHVETAQAKMNLAWALYSIGNQEETYSLAKEGRDVIQEVLGKKHEAYLGADKLIKKIRRGMPRYGNELTVPDSTERPPSPEHERNSRYDGIPVIFPSIQ